MLRRQKRLVSPRIWTVDGQVVQPRFRALVLAARTAGGIKVSPFDASALSDEVQEILRLIREGSPVGSRLVRSVFGEGEEATYLREREALSAMLARPELTEYLDQTLDELRQGICHPNDALTFLIDVFTDMDAVEPDSLWAGKAAIERLVLSLDVRRLVRQQIEQVARELEIELDPDVVIDYRAQTVDILHTLASVLGTVEDLLHAFLSSQFQASSSGLDSGNGLSNQPVLRGELETSQDMTSLALFLAFAERCREAGEPLPVQWSGWLDRFLHHPGRDAPERSSRRKVGNFASHTSVGPGVSWGASPPTPPVSGCGAGRVKFAPRPTALPALIPALVSMSILQSAHAAPSAMIAPGEEPSRPTGTLAQREQGEAQALAAQLRIRLEATGTYTFDQLAEYFGFTSPEATAFLYSFNLSTLAQMAKSHPDSLATGLIPAGQHLVIPATLLPPSQVTSLDDVARTFKVDPKAVARLNPSWANDQRSKPKFQSGHSAFVLVPAGDAGLVRDDMVVETEPVRFDVARPQGPFILGRVISQKATPMAQKATRHIRLHYRLPRDTTVGDFARALGLPATDLAQYNGWASEDANRVLKSGQVILIPGTSRTVHRGDTLEAIAREFDARAEGIELLNGKVFVGQILFIPLPPDRLPSARVIDSPKSQVPSSKFQVGSPTSDLGFPTWDFFPEFVEMPSYLVNWDEYKQVERELRSKYRGKLFRSIQAMPEDLRTFYLTSVYWGSQFIGVPWQAVAAIHNTELVGKGFRPFEEAVSVAGARGPGQITAGYWNGWSAASRPPFTNFADIVRHGGLGFNWGLRHAWVQYRRGNGSLDDLVSGDTNILYLINNVVSTARGLYSSGVRGFPPDPKQWTRAQIDTLRKAAMLYNSGGTNPNVRQGPGSSWTVGTYADNAERVARSLPANPFELIPNEARERELRRQIFVAYDANFGATLTDQQLRQILANQSEKVGDYTTGKSTAGQVAQAMMDQVAEDLFKQQNQTRPDTVPWPYFYNREAMQTQRLAVKYLGTMLDLSQLRSIMDRHHNDIVQIEAELKDRVEAKLVALVREKLAASNQQVVLNSTVRKLVQELVNKVFDGQLDPGQPDLNEKLVQAAQLIEQKVQGGGGVAGVIAVAKAAPTQGGKASTPPTNADTRVQAIEQSAQRVSEQIKASTNQADHPEARMVGVTEVLHRRSLTLSTLSSSPAGPIPRNVRLFAARLAGRQNEFIRGGSVDWKALEKAHIEATITLKPGEKLDYVRQFGPFSTSQGYAVGQLVSGDLAPGVGACQVATLFKAVALKVPDLKVWNGVRHPAIRGLEDISAVSIFTADPRQNLIITNQGQQPITLRMKVSGDTATLQAEVHHVSAVPSSKSEVPGSKFQVPSPTSDLGVPTWDLGLGTSVGERIAQAATNLIGKYAYGNMRDGPDRGFYVCTDLVNAATAAAGTPIVDNYKSSTTVRWVGTHLKYFQGARIGRMVDGRAREFRGPDTLPEKGWVIFIRREPYREASHEGIVSDVRIKGDTAVVETVEALGGFRADRYNPSNNIQRMTYTYRKGQDGVWRQSGVTPATHIAGYGVIKG